MSTAASGPPAAAARPGCDGAGAGKETAARPEPRRSGGRRQRNTRRSRRSRRSQRSRGMRDSTGIPGSLVLRHRVAVEPAGRELGRRSPGRRQQRSFCAARNDGASAAAETRGRLRPPPRGLRPRGTGARVARRHPPLRYPHRVPRTALSRLTNRRVRVKGTLQLGAQETRWYFFFSSLPPLSGDRPATARSALRAPPPPRRSPRARRARTDPAPVQLLRGRARATQAADSSLAAGADDLPDAASSSLDALGRFVKRVLGQDPRGARFSRMGEGGFDGETLSYSEYTRIRLDQAGGTLRRRRRCRHLCDETKESRTLLLPAPWMRAWLRPLARPGDRDERGRAAQAVCASTTCTRLATLVRAREVLEASPATSARTMSRTPLGFPSRSSSSARRPCSG